MDIDTLFNQLDALPVETSSWGIVTSGIRLGSFHQPWAAKAIDEKFFDASPAVKITDIWPLISLRSPGIRSTTGRPLLAQWRVGRGLDLNPVQAFRSSGYTQAVARERNALQTTMGVSAGIGAFW